MSSLIPSFLTDLEWKRLVHALKLSPRQAAVVAGVLCAMTEQEIADQLAISVHTVHAHLAHVYRKTFTHDRTQLVAHIFAAYTRLGMRGYAAAEVHPGHLVDRTFWGPC